MIPSLVLQGRAHGSEVGLELARNRGTGDQASVGGRQQASERLAALANSGNGETTPAPTVDATPFVLGSLALVDDPQRGSLD